MTLVVMREVMKTAQMMSLALLASLTACGGGSGTPPASTPTLTSIAVGPASPSIAVGASQQFTATGSYSDGNTQNIASSVTWNSSATNVATIAGSGTAMAVAVGQTTITAASGSVSGATTLTVVAIPSSIVITPLAPALGVGQTVQFTATANYSEGSTKDVTQNAAWTSSSSGVASISAGVATGVAVGQTSITASYYSVSGSSAVYVIATPYSNASFKGQYAFTLTTSGSPRLSGAVVPEFFVGSFNADGNGSISGIFDGNTASGLITNAPLSGSYSVNTDGRGNLTLSSQSLPSTSYRFVLSSNQLSPMNPAVEGQFVQFDAMGSAVGRFVQQDSSYFSNTALDGNDVFRFTGALAGSGPADEVGVFVTDGNGNITSGLADSDFEGSQTFVSSTYSIGSNGRGTLSLNNGTHVFNFVVYVIGQGNVILMSTDQQIPLLGFTEQQPSGTMFSNTTLATNAYSFLLDDDPARVQGPFDTVGRVGFDGLGGVTGGTQDECLCPQNSIYDVILSNNIIQGGTYNVASNGRTTVTENTAAGTRTYIYYLVSANRAYVMNAADGAVGAAEIQAPTPTTSTLTGYYAFAGVDYLSEELSPVSTAAVVWMYADGVGNISGVGDIVLGGSGSTGSVSSVALSGTYTIDANGRAAVNLSSPVGANSYVLYVVSNAQSYILGISPPSPANLAPQTFDGTVLLQ